MPNKKHEHNNCQHESVNFCKDCSNIYCDNCNMEWFVKCDKVHGIWNYNTIGNGDRFSDLWKNRTTWIGKTSTTAVDTNEVPHLDRNTTFYETACKHTS